MSSECKSLDGAHVCQCNKTREDNKNLQEALTAAEAKFDILKRALVECDQVIEDPLTQYMSDLRAVTALDKLRMAVRSTIS